MYKVIPVNIELPPNPVHELAIHARMAHDMLETGDLHIFSDWTQKTRDAIKKAKELLHKNPTNPGQDHATNPTNPGQDHATNPTSPPHPYAPNPAQNYMDMNQVRQAMTEVLEKFRQQFTGNIEDFQQKLAKITELLDEIKNNQSNQAAPNNYQPPAQNPQGNPGDQNNNQPRYVYVPPAHGGYWHPLPPTPDGNPQARQRSEARTAKVMRMQQGKNTYYYVRQQAVQA